MAEINAACTPMVVHLENVRENVSAQRKRVKLQKDSVELVPKGKRTGQPSLPPCLGRGSTSSEKHGGGVPRLIELYQFPGFSKDGPTPLPHHTAFSTVVAHVVRAQPRLNQKPRYKAAFQNNLFSVLMEHFVTDMFWWLFLQNFQPNGHVQDCLFSRIAENYIRILSHNQSSRIGNVFLREFPCTLGQTLYSCFCCCFPASCSTIRQRDFLQKLCFTAYQWTGGLYPSPNVFMKWNFRALEPDEASSSEFTTENEKKETESCVPGLDGMLPSSCSSAKRDSALSSLTANRRPATPDAEDSHTNFEGTLFNMTEQNINMPSQNVENTGSEDIKGSNQKAATDHSNRKSAKKGGWPKLEFKQCTFDLWGNSPLVQHYMHKCRQTSSTGQGVLVRRTEVHGQAPADSVTQRQMLRQCRERSVAHWRDLKALRARCAEELSVLQRTRVEQRHLLLRKQAQILSHPSSVKQYCLKLYPKSTKKEEAELGSESSLAQ